MKNNEPPVLPDISLEDVIEAMADPVTVVSSDYEVVFVNKEARRLFRSETSASMPGKCYEVSHHRESPCAGHEHPCPMEEARKANDAVRVLHTHYSRDGERRIVEITASPLWSRDGTFAGIVESQRDVTVREQIRQERERHAGELEKSNRLKDLFVDIMRHDMINPAWHIHTLASILMKNPEAAEFREDLSAISRSALKMSEMVQNASVLAKIEGDEELPLKRLNIVEHIRGAARDLASSAGEKGMSIVLPDEEECFALANPLIADVFLNLLGNAIKYGQQKTAIAIGISDRSGQWCITVTNRGKGIPDDAKESIFTRFTRLSKGEVEGSGLGLTIVKMVVEAHHGSVSVRDNPAGGSIFEVCLPKP